jgi:C4-dicarboxylate-specific signal transduction histidine kinase
MFKNINLKTKITLSIVLSFFILCILVVISVNFYLEKKLVDEKLTEINKLTIEQAHESIQIFKNNKIFAKMLGTRTRVKEYLLNKTEARRMELLGVFNEYAKEDTKYLSLYLLDKNGIALISTDPTFVGQDYSFRDYFKEGMKGNSYTDILLGKTSNQFGYYFSHPVIDDKGNVLGVFVAKVNNKEIDDAILNSEASRDNGIMLVDKYGIVVISNKSDRFLKSLGKLNIDEKEEILKSKKFLDREILSLQYDIVQEKIHNGESVQGLRINDKEDGEIEIVNVNKIGEFPFYLVSETGLDTLNKTILDTIIILILLIVLGVIFTSFVLYRFITISLLPLKEFKFIAEAISFGDFSKRINIKTKDELGDLAQTFNKMSNDLEDLYKNLEKKVKERTEKLEESEKILKNTLGESEKMNKLIVGRELEMIRLKKEAIELRNKK